MIPKYLPKMKKTNKREKRVLENRKDLLSLGP